MGEKQAELLAGPASVLIVEDENTIALDVEQSLKKLGYKVSGLARSGAEAIEKATSCRPDVVLMDIRLGGPTDGIDTGGLLWSKMNIPVVFLTAYADEGTLERAKSAAPFGYVVKPFHDQELHAAIMMALFKHKAFQELEERVRERTILLEEAVRSRDEFLLVAAHELRTPLTALQLQLQGLERMVQGTLHSSPSDDERKIPGKIEKAVRSAGRLCALVERLLDVSGLGAEKLPLLREETSLSQVVMETVETFRAKAESAGCQVQLEVADPAIGTWDRSRLEQVVSNLLSNAIKYGGGKPVDVSVAADGKVAILKVADQGIGIAEADRERIFGRFERAVSLRHYGGLGLGLYITRRLVEAHGGTIWVDSSPGAGATFSVELPQGREAGRS